MEGVTRKFPVVTETFHILVGVYALSKVRKLLRFVHFIICKYSSVIKEKKSPGLYNKNPEEFERGRGCSGDLRKRCTLIAVNSWRQNPMQFCCVLLSTLCTGQGMTSIS